MILGKRDGSGYRVGENTQVKRSQVGEGSTIDRDCLILCSEIGRNCDIEKRNLIQTSVIGDMTYTGEGTSIMWANIGKYCCISRMVDIGGNEHNYRAASMMPAYRIRNKLGGHLTKHPEESPVTVGNDVWIGQGVSIIRKEGLTIGNGAVIGSGAVVTKSIPDYAIVAGVPARVLRYRFPEDMIRRLLALSWWDWPEEDVLAAWPLLTGELTPEVLTALEELRGAKQ